MAAMAWARILEPNETVGTPWTSTGADIFHVERADGGDWNADDAATLELELAPDIWEPDAKSTIKADSPSRYARIAPGDGDRVRLRVNRVGFVGRWRGRRLPIKS